MHTAKVTIDSFYCKGCGLCVSVCPKHLLSIDLTTINEKGNHVASIDGSEACVLCSSCAYICPDAAIKLERVEA